VAAIMVVGTNAVADAVRSRVVMVTVTIANKADTITDIQGENVI
jgi:hypothetical protein